MVVASRQQPFMYRIGCSFTLRGKPDLSPPIMNFYEFKESLAKTKPPAELMPALAALWWAGKDNWERAHKMAPSVPVGVPLSFIADSDHSDSTPIVCAACEVPARSGAPRNCGSLVAPC